MPAVLTKHPLLCACSSPATSPPRQLQPKLTIQTGASSTMWRCSGRTRCQWWPPHTMRWVGVCIFRSHPKGACQASLPAFSATALPAVSVACCQEVANRPLTLL